MPSLSQGNNAVAIDIPDFELLLSTLEDVYKAGARSTPGVPCPACGEEAVGCATFTQGELVIRKQLGCFNCKTMFEPVVSK